MSTISQRLTKAIKTDLRFKDDMICFDMHRWSIKKLADYIILHRKEIGLYKKSDFEIDRKKIWDLVERSLGAEIVEEIWKKKPIKAKGEK